MELSTVTWGEDKEMVLIDFSIKGYVVPKGFVFDGASTPRFLWPIIPPYKRTKKGACLHDYLCRIAECPSDRLAADRLFKEVLIDCGVMKHRADLAYLGVRLGAALGIGVYYDY
jgi:hypothetical protein